MKWLCALLMWGCLCAEEVDLSRYEGGLYSEYGEDGVLARLFQLIPPRSRFCVELGAGDGITHNQTLLLRLQGWKSVLFDRERAIAAFGQQKAFITAENVNRLFEKWDIPQVFDLLSVHLNYNDFYIWRALHPKYRPAVVVIQYNSVHQADEALVAKYQPYYVGDGTIYFGASMLALERLGREKGYTLVYAEKGGRSLFFVRDEVLQAAEWEFRGAGDVEALDRGVVRGEGPRFDPRNRRFLTYDECGR